jgi:inhibitor of cysteine peptidase
MISGRTAVPTARKAAVAALLPLTAGCGLAAGGPTSHPTADTSITAEVGDRFELAFDGENASTRSHWYVVDPKPDSSVVRSRGEDYEADDEDMIGGGGTLTFTFEATGKGTTRIVVTHCTFTTCRNGTTTPASASPPPSPSPSASPAPAPPPERITYTVTVN